jgi:uncharacterized damage-inducible protein DinB
MQRTAVWAVTLVIAGLVTASCVSSSEPATEATAPETATMDGDSVASARAVHDTVKTYLTATADQVPEDLYSFRPTEEVRTMGEILWHVAESSAGICASASGLSAPDLGDPATAKADIQQALASALAFCDGAFTAVADAPNESVEGFFFPGQTRLGVLAFNNAHNFEHYGNLVTYMRINGMVPPSSQ